MPFRISFVGEVMHVDFFDTVTRQDLNDLLPIVAKIERTRETTPSRIADMSAVTRMDIDFRITWETVHERKAMRFKNSFKTAIVVSSPVQTGFVRMYQELMDHPQITVRIFDNAADAETWINEFA